MQGTVSVLAVTGVQDRVKGEGAGNDGVRGVTVGTDRHRQHWEAAVRLSLKPKKRKSGYTVSSLPSQGKFVIPSPRLYCSVQLLQ